MDKKKKNKKIDAWTDQGVKCHSLFVDSCVQSGLDEDTAVQIISNSDTNWSHCFSSVSQQSLDKIARVSRLFRNSC